MKIAHLILAHAAPLQLERLIKSLSHPDADIYMHIDGKTDLSAFEYLGNYPNVFFIKNRVKVHWGSYNIVQATLNGFRQIGSSGKDYLYVNLLSGQDYPLKSPEYIHRYLLDNQGTAFMNYLLFYPDWIEALGRIQYYHFNNFQVIGRYKIQGIINKLLPKRKMPYGLVPAGRSQWFTLPLEQVKYILNYWDTHARLRRFIKLTWAPDEFIFQTILYNSKYRGSMVNNDLRYIDWSGGGVSPKLLTITDANKLLISRKLFARKFDLTKDEAILNLIDKQP